jgi:hypothetical protein
MGMNLSPIFLVISFESGLIIFIKIRTIYRILRNIIMPIVKKYFMGAVPALPKCHQISLSRWKKQRFSDNDVQVNISGE